MHPTPPLSLVSSLVVLLADWCLFASVARAPSLAVATTTLAALASFALVYRCEQRAGFNAFASPWLRALGAAVAVAIPLPLYGSLLALACLAWAWRGAQRASAPGPAWAVQHPASCKRTF